MILRCHGCSMMDTVIGAVAVRFRRFLRLLSTAVWTDSQCSFLDPTSQLRLIGRLGVFLSLAFRLDHVSSAQRPASDLSFLALSARYQVPSSFNSPPGYPNFLTRRWH